MLSYNNPPGHFLRAIAPIRDKLYKFKGWASYGAGRGMGHFAPFCCTRTFASLITINGHLGPVS